MPPLQLHSVVDHRNLSPPASTAPLLVFKPGKVPRALWELPCLRVVALQHNSFTGERDWAGLIARVAKFSLSCSFRRILEFNPHFGVPFIPRLRDSFVLVSLRNSLVRRKSCRGIGSEVDAWDGDRDGRSETCFILECCPPALLPKHNCSLSPLAHPIGRSQAHVPQRPSYSLLTNTLARYTCSRCQLHLRIHSDRQRSALRHHCMKARGSSPRGRYGNVGALRCVLVHGLHGLSKRLASCLRLSGFASLLDAEGVPPECLPAPAVAAYHGELEGSPYPPFLFGGFPSR